MNFKRVNNITGWVICIIACSVYILTMEATGSFWDCGEFASSAYKLQIPHPPGAPLFVLIGRLFMMFFDPKHAATGINLMSALASGFSILFLFWTVTHFARKIVMKLPGEWNNNKTYSVMAAGIVGALAYTFSDSFWYSAVEGEVYALSSLFTGLVFWAMVKWEEAADADETKGMTGHFTPADRWIILVFYLMGLSIGVHLLNLLTIPAFVMMYYFKRYKYTRWGMIWAFLIGCVITGLVQKAVIQWTINGAGALDVVFVNDFGLPFFTGFAFFFVLMGAIIWFGLKFAARKNWNFLKLGLWSFSFMLLGYFTYFTTLVRSNADPSVDMYNVDNPVSLAGYLSREQYGDWPIIYGQDFTANPIDMDVTETWIKGKNKYENNGRKAEYVYNPEDKHFFPRMWDASNDQGHADYYANWLEIGKDQKTGEYERPPTMGDNIGYFLSYQVNWMYWRYFMWNFAGKQNDIQGISPGNVRDGNWLTGISFYDNLRLGDQSKMPDTLKANKSNNKLFMLPMILGIIGLIYQFKKDKRDGLIVGLLFFFTGFAIVLYLNQAGNQPRERDYAYVGSFYAFAMWIGLGVLQVKDWFSKLFKNPMGATIAAAAICTLAVPVLMACQEWDDHDRSKKTLARDLATDYLESCAPNAILISFGDNDTYPLWYAQEVEGIRTDVRVINYSLLGTDWYINELRYKVNKSDRAPLILSEEQIMGSNRDQVAYNSQSPLRNNVFSLDTLIRNYIASEDNTKKVKLNDGKLYNSYPSKKVYLSVNKELVLKNGTVNPGDSVVSSLNFEISKNYLYKNDLAILDIIASNNWNRPIYFTSPEGAKIGFENYLRMDGLSYRLVPVANSNVNQPWVTNKMMDFKFGNCNIPGVYYDEENRRHLNSIRMAYAIAAGNLAQSGKKDSADKLLKKCDAMMDPVNFPYGLPSRGQQHDYFSLQMLQASYLVKDTVLITKISQSLKKDIEQQNNFYNNLSDAKKSGLEQEMRQLSTVEKDLMQMEGAFKAEQQGPPKTENPIPITNSPTPMRDSPKTISKPVSKPVVRTKH